VPVVEHGQMVGIVSIDDVVKFAVEEMDLERDVLRDRLSHLGTSRHLG
jgi:Mg/Co/Ni transporter MgtE